MGRIKNSLFFLSVLFLIGCSSHTGYYDSVAKEIYLFAKEQKKNKEPIVLEGVGVHSDGVIKHFNMDFGYIQHCNLDKARKVYLEKAHAFIKQINDNNKFDFITSKHPIDIENLDFRLVFHTLKGAYPFDYFFKGDRVDVVFNIDKRIIYGILDLNMGERGVYRVVHEETYEEALRIVENNP